MGNYWGISAVDSLDADELRPRKMAHCDRYWIRCFERYKNIDLDRYSPEMKSTNFHQTRQKFENPLQQSWGRRREPKQKRKEQERIKILDDLYFPQWIILYPVVLNVGEVLWRITVDGFSPVLKAIFRGAFQIEFSNKAKR